MPAPVAQELLVPIKAPQAADVAAVHAASGEGEEAAMLEVPTPTVAGTAARAAALGRSAGDADDDGVVSAGEQVQYLQATSDSSLV